MPDVTPSQRCWDRMKQPLLCLNPLSYGPQSLSSLVRGFSMPDVSETLRSRGILCDLAMHVEQMSCGYVP